MPRRRNLDRLGLTSADATWKRWQRPIAAILLAHMTAIGCASGTGALEPPTTTPEVEPYLRQYEDQLERQGVTVEEATAYLEGGGSLDTLEGNGDAPGDLLTAERLARLDEGALDTPQRDFVSWKLIEGVAEYRLGPGDIVQVTVFLGPETPVATTYRVLADGTLFVPRFEIGEVGAGGLTPTELSRELTERYRRYVPSGYAEVRVDEYTAWEATLVGEIRVGDGIGPGTYLLRGRETAAEFIFSHGGPTANADLSDVRLVRDGVEQRLDLARALSGTGGENPALDAGDVVRVPSIAVGASRYFVLGEVNTPGVFTLTESLTVLDAIAQAGSYNFEAKIDGVFLSRSSTGEVIPLDLDVVLGQADFAGDVPIQAGDFLVVPRRGRTFWEQTRDWIGLATLFISVATVVELIRR